jgi:hypothetical protein
MAALSEAQHNDAVTNEEPNAPRVEIRFGAEGGVPGLGEEPRSFVRINGEDLPVVHVRADYDFVSSKPPRLRMEVMDTDYRFHALAGHLVDERTALALDALFDVFGAASAAVLGIEAKKGSEAEVLLGKLRAAVDAFRNTGLAQADGLQDLKRYADAAGSAAWPDAEDDERSE